MPDAAASHFDRALAALLARGPGRMVPDLDRITDLAGLLGDPQSAYPSVHVTGTNGKGSVVRMVGALCSAAGLSAGTYTSPHLQSVRERLSVAGRPISAARFAEVYDDIAALAQLVDDESVRRDGDAADLVTFFELLTAMAYWWFADLPVDVGVFEVGMGGRWDATNLVRGDVAVVNEIDVDHSELGATPVEVAGEKVGIIKPGSHVVTAGQRPDVLRVIEDAATAVGATVWRFGDHLDVADRRVAVGGQLIALRVGERVVDDILLPMFGAHQARNAALALGAFAALTGVAFDAMDDDVVRHGLGAVTVPGRLEIVRREPTVVLDGAHNPHGARAAAAALEESFGFRELVLVIGCLDDKDIGGILAELRDVASHVIVTRAPGPRGAAVERMHEAALATWQGTGRVVEVADDVAAALELAESVAGDGDGILVAGSLLTVGAARDVYLPTSEIDDTFGDDDAVVREPGDDPPEATDADGIDAEGTGADHMREDDLDEATVDELAELLRDEEAFRVALDDLFDAEDDDPSSDS